MTLDPSDQDALERQSILEGLAVDGVVDADDYDAIMGSSSNPNTNAADDDDMSVIDGSGGTPRRRPDPPPPRESIPRGAKTAAAMKTDVKTEVKTESKADSKAKVGDKRKPGGQPGPRGPNGQSAKYAKPPKVLKGADAPTVNLISPDKTENGALPCDANRHRHALRVKFQCVLNHAAPPPFIRAVLLLCFSFSHTTLSLCPFFVMLL